MLTQATRSWRVPAPVMPSPPPQSPAPALLVLAYGNTLRSDDGVGPAVGRRVEELALPGVRVVIAHQLFPELADEVSRAGAVVFVDASVEPLPNVAMRPVEPAGQLQSVAHACDPGALLGLARDAFGRCPPAWCVHIPVAELGFGETLSPRAVAGRDRAVELIREFAMARGTPGPP